MTTSFETSAVVNMKLNSTASVLMTKKTVTSAVKAMINKVFKRMWIRSYSSTTIQI